MDLEHVGLSDADNALLALAKRLTPPQREMLEMQMLELGRLNNTAPPLPPDVDSAGKKRAH